MAKIPPPSFHPDMEKELLYGRKRCTTRREKLGEVGDEFTLKGQTFRFVEVREEKFGVIKYLFYRCEGFFSPADFEIFWIRIHRGHLPAPNEPRWLHIMERVE